MKMKILYVEDDANIAEIYILMIKDRFPAVEITYYENGMKALLLKPVSASDLTDKIEWCIGGENNILKIYDQPTTNNDEKVALRSDVFMKINIVPCDIYLKLADGKFVKIINKEELFESQLIQKLILKGVTHFYVNRSELSKYSESSISTLNSLLKTKKHKMDEVQKSQLANKAIEVMRSNLLKCGFSETSLGIADEITNLQLDMIKSSPELSQFLEKFQNFRKVDTDHTRLVSYIIVSILRELTWDSESTLHKMCTASLLHDFSLPEELNQKVTKKDKLEKLTEDEKKNYLRHPEESSHLAKHFEPIASGIEQYILEHHELPDGNGFPRKLTYNNIHPLSATLHLADLVAELLWEFDFDIDKIKQVLDENRLFYLRGFYRKPYQALINIMK